MRFCSLGSGSSGNALVIEARSGATTSRVLVDCGFSQRELQARLARAGLAIGDLDAIFITHEHGDHVGCAFALARRHGIPLWTSRGTWRAIGEPALGAGLLGFARDGEAISIGDLQLQPFTVPHDALEPLQLTCTDGHRRLGVLTDVGSSTAHLIAQLQGCEALVLECNHDRALLAASRYPASLKARIDGPHGHLANDSAAQILAQCHHPRLRHIVAAHLSEQNNRASLAAEALATACGARQIDIVIANAATGAEWLAIA